MRIPAIRVNQWLDDWNSYNFSEADRQRKPEPHFYVSSMSAAILKKLSNIPRRGTSTKASQQEAIGPRVDDIGIQRALQRERSDEIKSFVHAGYPWATLRKAEQDRFPDLKKPGWLPTALVVNVIKETTEREGVTPDPLDLVCIEKTGSNTAEIVIPEGAESPGWALKGRLLPLEVIDGQHRLLAFDDESADKGQFELPVVLFEDLDISWQAYLFWTINISPKRIGPSLAYDLYPLLRTEAWLDPVPGPIAYRETRAQELTEALWSNPESPWYRRIGMLGRERGKVTQAAFVRTLSESFIRRSDPVADRPGGLFGAPVRSSGDTLLPWSRSQQAAYLIFLWSSLERAIKDTAADWANYIREITTPEQREALEGKDPAFAGDYSLLATDQGVRGFLQVSNDISFVSVDDLDIASWLPGGEGAATLAEEVEEALQNLRSNTACTNFTQELCSTVASFDWRTLATPGLDDITRNRQALYRTGTGYREVRRQLLIHLSDKKNGGISEKARDLIIALGF